MDEIEVEAILKKHGLELMEKIGYGGFSDVYKVYSCKYHECFACKILDIHEDFLAKNKVTSYVREVEILQQIQHPNIINIYDNFQDGKYYFILLEICTSGTLENLIRHSKTPILQKTLDSIIFQMLTAVSFCHLNNVAHHDIKPSNFCIDQYTRIKLLDFGVATLNEGHNSHLYGGTMIYSAPEILQKKPYDPFKADVYSLGVSILHLVMHHMPALNETKTDVQKYIEESINSLDQITTPYIKEIITKALISDPAKRADASELLDIIRPHIPEKNHHHHLQTHKSVIMSSAPYNLFKMPTKSRSIQKLDELCLPTVLD